MVEHPESCAEWRSDLAAWAVAQITPDREAALEAHLATCAACSAEADELMAIAAVTLAAAIDGPSNAFHGGRPVDTADEAPSDELGPRIARRITRERRRQTVRRSLVAAVGAAAAAAVVVAALLVATGDDAGPGKVHGTEFAFATVPQGASATAVVGRDDAAGSVVQLVAEGLDPDTTYALWLSDPKTHPDRVPAGTFRPDDDGKVHVVLHCALPPDQVGRVWATSLAGVELDTA